MVLDGSIDAPFSSYYCCLDYPGKLNYNKEISKLLTFRSEAGYGGLLKLKHLQAILTYNLILFSQGERKGDTR
jgi:hypothetical protein